MKSLIEAYRTVHHSKMQISAKADGRNQILAEQQTNQEQSNPAALLEKLRKYEVRGLGACYRVEDVNKVFGINTITTPRPLTGQHPMDPESGVDKIDV